jgi:hypothetical protein
MKPRLPPAEPIVATITISCVVSFFFAHEKKAKKKSAAIVGPSSITPNDSVRNEFMAQSAIERMLPATSARPVIADMGGASPPLPS